MGEERGSWLRRCATAMWLDPPNWLWFTWRPVATGNGLQVLGDPLKLSLVTLRLSDGSAATTFGTVSSGGEANGTKTEVSNPNVFLTIHSDSSELSREALRVALAKELVTDVTLNESGTLRDDRRAVIVKYRSDSHELAVTVVYPGRANTRRVVETPTKIDDVVSVAVLLAHELFREPASEVPVTPSVATTIAEAPIPSVATSKPNPARSQP